MKRNKRKVLILTDHARHSSENSLYELSVKLMTHPLTETVEIASRGNKVNDNFFSCKTHSDLYATRIDDDFAFNKANHPLSVDFLKVDLKSFDLVWLRMPPPLSDEFLNYIDKVFSTSVVINNPKAIQQSGAKSFLLNFPEICPPMKLCHSLSEIDEFRKKFSIVLKPLNEYGGRGIVKVENDLVSTGNEFITFEQFSENYTYNPLKYLAVKYLENVSQGDKRIVVVHGQILGASLRLPAENSWICNVALGGTSNMAEVTSEEEEIIRTVNPKLSQLGIVMYGVDTLVNDDGKRVLSEINTTSIGGLPQIAKMRNEPLVERAVNLIWKYYEDSKKRNG